MSAVPISYDFEPTGEIIAFPHSIAPSRGAERALPRTKSKSATAIASILVRVAFQGLALTVVAGFAFLASGLAGNVALEGARRESIHDSERARQVVREEVGLATDVTRLRSEESINAWASYNLFVPGYTLDQKPTLASAGTSMPAHAAI